MEEEILPSELDSSVDQSDHSAGWRKKRKLLRISKKNGMGVFSLKSMVRATDNFLSSNKLGQGGYGIVYKVMLPYNVDLLSWYLKGNKSAIICIRVC